MLRKRPDPRKVLYVHLANDGAIFVIWGGTGEQAWIREEQLHKELARVSEMGGSLIYSRETPESDPPPEVERVFQAMTEYKLPIQLLEQAHPEALVPRERRRSVLHRPAGG
jgi:hypothetical protein